MVEVLQIIIKYIFDYFVFDVVLDSRYGCYIVYTRKRTKGTWTKNQVLNKGCSLQNLEI